MELESILGVALAVSGVGAAPFLWAYAGRRKREFARAVEGLGLALKEDSIEGAIDGVELVVLRETPDGRNWGVLVADIPGDWPLHLDLRRSTLADYLSVRHRVVDGITFPSGETELLEDEAFAHALARFFDVGATRIENGMLEWRKEGWYWPEEQLRDWLAAAAGWAKLLAERVEGARATLRVRREAYEAQLAELGLTLAEKELKGCHQNVEVVLERRGEGPRAKTWLRASLGPDLPKGFRVRRESVGDALSRLVGKDDVRTGDAALDRLVRIDAEETQRAERLVRKPAIVWALSQLWAKFPDAELADGELRLELPRWLPPIPELETWLAAVAPFVQAFQKVTDWPSKRATGSPAPPGT